MEENGKFAAEVGLEVAEVALLRSEFARLGRNPTESDIEILALENGVDEVDLLHLFIHLNKILEDKAKRLYAAHCHQRRVQEGFCPLQRPVHEYAS